MEKMKENEREREREEERKGERERERKRKSQPRKPNPFRGPSHPKPPSEPYPSRLKTRDSELRWGTNHETRALTYNLPKLTRRGAGAGGSTVRKVKEEEGVMQRARKGRVRTQALLQVDTGRCTVAL